MKRLESQIETQTFKPQREAKATLYIIKAVHVLQNINACPELCEECMQLVILKFTE